MFPYVRELFRSPRYRCIRAGDALYNKDIVGSPKTAAANTSASLSPPLMAPVPSGHKGQWDSPAGTPHPQHVAASGCLRHWAVHRVWVFILRRDPSCGHQLAASQSCSPEGREGESDRVKRLLLGSPQKGERGRSSVCSPTPHISFLLALVHNVCRWWQRC